jgi:ABC-2 type transport system permease protein
MSNKYWKPWKIAQKEFKVTRRKKSVISYVVALPLLLAIFFTLVVKNDFASGISSNYQLGFESLTYFYVVFAAILPSSLAAYSIVGEKIEKSLEPLLATPVSDGEILLGKSIAAFLPSILSIWLGASIFMTTTDLLTHGSLSFYYFPNWNAMIMLFLLAPLAAITSIELAVIVSSRVTDVRGANQFASLMFVPFMAVFVAAIEGVFPFSISNLLIFSGLVLVSDVALFRVSRSVFKREEILTKWK